MRAIAICAFLVCLSGAARAQTPEPAPTAASIQELRAEVERLKSALDDLAARLDRAGESTQPQGRATTPTSPVPTASPAEPTAQGPETSPPAVPRFDFYGDTLVRLATLKQTFDECSSCPRRTVGRLRIRFGVEGHLAPGLLAVMGLGSGELNDPNSVYQTLGGNLGRKVATWDRAYVFFRPPQAQWMELTAGKFPYPWLRSSLTFDIDFYPEGLSERFSFDLKRAGALKNLSLQGLQIIVNEQAAGPDTLMVGGQFAATVHPPGAVTTRVLFTGMEIKHPENVLRSQLDGSNVGVRNTNAIVSTGGQAFYASGFRYANLIVENGVKTPWASMPFTATVEYQRNLRAISSGDSAASLRLDAGRQQQRGDWGFGWHVFRVEQDAIVSSLGESDWRAPSNVWQHRFGVTRILQEHVQALFTWYRGRTLDRNVPGAVLVSGLPAGQDDPWANRLYFDLRYVF